MDSPLGSRNRKKLALTIEDLHVTEPELALSTQPESIDNNFEGRPNSHLPKSSQGRPDFPLPQTSSNALYYGVFFFSGIHTMLLSVLIPKIRSKGIMLSGGDSAIGGLIAAQLTGQLLGPLLVSSHPARALTASIVVTGLAASLLGTMPSIPLLLLGIYGTSLGLTMATTNTLVGIESPAGQRGTRLELLNAFWPLGAACTPLCVGLLGSQVPMRAYFFAAASSLLVLPFFLWKRWSQRLPANSHPDERQERAPARLGWLCLLCALAGGVESAVSSWSPTFALRYLNTPNAAGIASSIFWIGILSGRIAASALLRTRPRSGLVLSCSLLSAASILLCSMTHHTTVLYLSIFVAAISIAPIYPLLIERSVHMRFGNLIFVSAGIGGSLLPWAIGIVSRHTGSLRIGLAGAAFSSTMLLLFEAVHMRQEVLSLRQPWRSCGR